MKLERKVEETIQIQLLQQLQDLKELSKRKQKEKKWRKFLRYISRGFEEEKNRRDFYILRRQ
ncbi:unnamed protein product [Paramecium octaurelia]|uniref:Uncharacterized protein n=1 Tax=Paramecium octaurelia TaxID=43137 RepID=A0A8S1RYL6_PAROT|nr:unnamed protein product [Paramecium octaurelia]